MKVRREVPYVRRVTPSSIAGSIVIALLAGFGMPARGEPARPTATPGGSPAALSAEGAPRGVMVDVGGFRLHLNCIGRGQPTVIIESGLGDHMDSWAGVQRAAARQTTVCSYDRAGSGWSDDDPVEPTLPRMTDNLRSLLVHGGVIGPYVLVGHGVGGILARRFAAAHPDEVVGLLLADSAHERQAAYLPPTLRGTPQGAAFRDRFCGVDAPFGLVRDFGLVNLHLPVSEPENLRPMYAADVHRTRFCAAVLDESRPFAAALERGGSPGDLGDLPVLVLTAGRGMAARSDAVRSGVAASVLDKWDAAWLRLQADLAELSTRGEHRIIEGAGTYLQLDRPQAVMDAIGDVLTVATRD